MSTDGNTVWGRADTAANDSLGNGAAVCLDSHSTFG